LSRPLKEVLHQNLARALYRKDEAEAVQLLERLKQEDPLSVQTRGQELELYLITQRLQEAERLAAVLVEQFPQSARILYLAGQTAYRRKHYAKAEAWLRESLLLYRHDQTERWLGKTLTALGRFEEAEPLLSALAKRYPECHLDLSWLYERNKAYAKALRELDAFLAHDPQHGWAKARQARLRAMEIEPQEMIEEAELLIALGEPLPEELAGRYIECLLCTGQGPKARQWVQRERERLSPALATDLGWRCYRLHALDLAFELFTTVFVQHHDNFKFLRALESCAERCNKTETLLALYERHAPEAKGLYGRMHQLKKKMERI
jgi:tetratricopeptide (TPR) repeat protein